MSIPQSILLDSSLLDLFQQLREARRPLTLEQDNLFRQAVTQGYGLLLDSLLLDLFQKLRDAGMALTLEQYDLLRQAVTQGYGLDGWQDLRRVCRLLWVKSYDNDDANIFDRTFDRYIQQHHAKMPIKPEPSEKTPSSTKPTQNLPQIPPRRRGVPSTQTTGEVQVPVAIQTSLPFPSLERDKKNFHFTPMNNLTININACRFCFC